MVVCASRDLRARASSFKTIHALPCLACRLLLGSSRPDSEMGEAVP
jgi:hypothetical protein